MGMISKINTFVETMISEKNQFDLLENEISIKRNSVKNILEELKNNQTVIIDSISKKIKVNNDETMIKILDTTLKDFGNAMDEVIEKTNELADGMKFIDDFEKQFTVAVFGKVKAGKSYLGNFIIGNTIRKIGIKTAYDKIDNMSVNVYDRGNVYTRNKIATIDEEKEINGEEFYVNNSEATSTIQWVNIGGMCWFDTPGIGSITQENEDLAKKYVKNADLVIFASNSDAAGTRQEFDEIKQLFEMEKPVLLLLTQSDTYDIDYDEETDEEISVLVPKSEKDRHDQEEYMLNTLREHGMQDLLKYANILTVSTKLANEALKLNDENLFEQSNMGLLLDKLTEITKNDAANIKKNTPKNRINEMINSIINNLNDVHTKINDSCASIEDSKRELEERKEWILEQIKSTVQIRVLDILAKAKVEVERDRVEISETELSVRINTAISECIAKVCKEEAISKTDTIPSLNLNIKGIGDMKMRQDSIPYEFVEIKSVPRPPKGLIEKAVNIFTNKTYYTSESKSETRFSIFDIGVNDNEIAHNITLQLETLRQPIGEFIGYLTKSYYEPIDLLQRKTEKEFIDAIKKLKELCAKC